MGLFGAMTASVAGLGVQGQALSVISDNLANTNTTGYKASRSLFNQMVTTSGNSGTSYNAGGVGMKVQTDQASQGSFTTTSSKTDLAISGNGFFKVGDTTTNTSSTSFYYTRAGSFSEDKEGYLVNPDGLYLQGWKTDSDGTILNIQELQPIELQSVGISAQGTGELSIDANLTSTTDLNGNYNTGASLASSLATILASPSTLADYTTDIRVYDDQGGARDLTFAFSKRADNLWDWQVYTDGSEIQGGTADTNTAIGSGTLRFDTSGKLLYATGTSVTTTWSGGAGTSDMTLNFGDYTGGKVVTSNTSLGFTDHVLDIAVEDSTFSTGTYTLRATAAGTFSLGTGSGGSFAGVETGITIGASGNREIYFPTSGVRISVDTNFVENPGSYPNDLGTFTVASISPLNEGVGSDGITQLAANFNTSGTNQNGFGAGTLSGISVDADGFVSGTFTNGETKKLFRVALAVFQNPDGLEQLSGSLLRTTEASGQALMKQPNQSGTGKIVGGNLEGSTTDIASEFSNMIVAQRAFQANSKVITTVDQMLNDLLQLR